MNLQQKYPELFTVDSSAPPGQIRIPEERYSVLELVTALQRELLFARRTADSAIHQLGGKPLTWWGAPRYAKLKFRPVVLGLAPSETARSTLAFDDHVGDMLARRWGLPGGFHQLVGLAKLATIWPFPMADLPLPARSRDALCDRLDALVVAGTFRDRVVVLVGAGALQAFGYPADALGPLGAQLVPGARAVIAMQDPQQRDLWRAESRRAMARQGFIQALLAARLPAGGHYDPPRPRTNTAAAALIASTLVQPSKFGTLSPTHVNEAFAVWRSLGGNPAGLDKLWSSSGPAVWQELCRLGLSTPRDLGSRLWWLDPVTGVSESYYELGRARVVGAKGQVKICEVLDNHGHVLEQGELPTRRTGHTWAEGKVAARGWDFAHIGLDRRLADLRGGAT